MQKLWSNALSISLKAEDGPTAVEYAVMLALIVVVLHRRPSRPWAPCQRHLPKISTTVNTSGS